MSEQETDEVGVAVPAARPGPSKLLSAARESLQMTQKEVADKLFLTTSFIQYIDDGEFDRFPKQAFVKGYLRTYARVVGLSGDEMVALYEAELEARTPDPEIRGVTEEKVGTAAITGPVLQSGLIGLAGLFVVILLIWYLVSDDDESSSAPVIDEPAVGMRDSRPAEKSDFDFVIAEDNDPGLEAIDDLTGTPAVLEANIEAEGDGTGVSASQLTADQSATAAAANQATQEVPAQVQRGSIDTADSTASTQRQVESDETETGLPVRLERTSDGDRSLIKVDAGGFDQLVMSFTDECWVEVSDSERGLVYNDLNRPADMLTVYGNAPFNVLLGKATGVEMIYNGRPFDLARHTARDSTAKFTVAD